MGHEVRSADTDIRVLLMRHGMAKSNEPLTKDARAGGDAPLNDEGRRELTRMARELQLAGFTITRIVSSPYLRTRQSSEIIGDAYGIEPEIDERLAEIQKGELEGELVEEVIKLEGSVPPDDEPFARVARQYENRLDVAARSIPVLWELYEHGPDAGGETLIVSHNNTIESMMGHALGLHPEHWRDLKIANAALSAIHSQGRFQWQLDERLFNVVPYTPQPSAISD